LSGCACSLQGGCVKEVQSDGVLDEDVGEWLPMLELMGTVAYYTSDSDATNRRVESVESSRRCHGRDWRNRWRDTVTVTPDRETSSTVKMTDKSEACKVSSKNQDSLYCASSLPTLSHHVDG
jgi:hypothetical protein